jgi:hypothetical protein
MSSFTYEVTFTIAHARHIASRIAGDLRLMSRYYSYPPVDKIDDYLEEIAQLLAKGYMEAVEFGYKRADGGRVFTLRYEVLDDGTLSDDRAGGVTAGYDVSNAKSFNHLWHSRKWWGLSQAERDRFEAGLPVQRTGQPEPTDGDGFWCEDRSYSSGGRSVRRRSFVPR